MKFFKNEFPDDSSFNPDNGWQAIREPTNLWVVQLMAIPFAILNLVIVVLFAGALGVEFERDGILFFVGLLIIIPIHELLHAIVFPDRLNSENVTFGIFPKKLMFFAYYLKEMSRNRFLLTLLMPYISISILGIGFVVLFGSNVLIENMVYANALAACADTMGVFLILKQIPKSATVRNKGIRTYWRVE